MAQAIPQKHVVEKYGPYGSKSQLNFNFQLKENEFIKEVIISHGFIVDGIGFTISNPDGGTHNESFGGKGEHESKVPLDPGEKITKISGTYGNYMYQEGYNCLIATIKIHTNRCQEGYGPYGEGRCVQSIRNFETPSSLDGNIVGVFGRQERYIQSVGIVVSKERQQVITTSVSMTNENDTGTLRFQGNKDWSGLVTSQHGYPSIISNNNTSKFNHQGFPDDKSSQGGSMGAVIYVGPDKVGGRDNVAWLVAWSVPGNTFSNKVYVECGLKYKFRHINWEAVRSKLRSSGPEKDYVDPHTGAAVYAYIENDEPKSTYELEVTFGVQN